MGVMMIPGTSIAADALASGHHRHHHNSMRKHQDISQLNACDKSDCSNSGNNSASVGSYQHDSSVRVSKSMTKQTSTGIQIVLIARGYIG